MVPLVGGQAIAVETNATPAAGAGKGRATRDDTPTSSANLRDAAQARSRSCYPPATPFHDLRPPVLV